MTEIGEPCFRCGVRPDVDCRHRKGMGPPRVPPPPEKKRAARHTAVHWKLAKGYRPVKYGER